MAIPNSNESPRALHLRRLVDETGGEELLAWPIPNEQDFALFARIIHIYSSIDFSLRFAAEVMDEQGLLSKPWKGSIATQNISTVSREVQSNQMWNESHRVAFERMDLHRRVRNLLAHFMVRRFPGEEAFVFITKSAADFKQVYGKLPLTEDMLFGVIDAAELYGLIPELRNLLTWVSGLPRDLSNPIDPP
jgi:hypothetical protein